jgi:exopolysaccharide biosynthesis polyprenyl glycosylphosphotransferase
VLKEHKNLFATIFRSIDLLIIFFSSLLAYYFRFHSVDSPELIIDLQFKVFLSSHLIFWLYFSYRFRLYESKRYLLLRKELLDVIKTIGISAAVAFIPAFFIRQHPLSRLFMIYCVLIQTSILLLFRLVLRKTLRYVRLRGYNYRHVLIVGRNSRAAHIARQINDSPEFGSRILGFIDADQNSCQSDTCYSYNIMGNLNNLEQILRTYVVDEIFVTLPIKSFYSQIEAIIALCEIVGVEVKIPLDIFNRKIAKTIISLCHNIKVINYYTSPRMTWKLFVKRFIDVTISATLLIGWAPLLVVVAAAIKASSKGPVFFVQQRIGYNGRVFKCLKFRTMVANAEEMKKDLVPLNEMDGPVFKIKDDPRITAVGRLLRKTSVDELPQLINVLKGDMSLVGPRPPVPEEVSKYKLTDRRRLSIRPGITCIWQVNGRNTITFEDWMKLDQQYIDQWSLWLDLKILLKTIPVVLLQKGAR